MAERRNFWEKEKGNYIFKAVKKASEIYIHGFSKNTNMSQDSEQSKHADTIIRNHVIWSMGAGLIPVLIADIFGSVVKMIPGLGSIIGGITVSVFAGASTYALGEVFKKHFSSGGTILDFDPERLRKLYKEQFEKGKKVVEDLKNEKPADGGKPSTTTDVVSRLKALAELKEQGILSEEEFTAMKKKILEE